LSFAAFNPYLQRQNPYIQKKKGFSEPAGILQKMHKKKAALFESRLLKDLDIYRGLHKLHKLFFGFFHHVCRNFCSAALFDQPFNLSPRHGANEIGDIVQSLLGFGSPVNAFSGRISGIMHNL